MEWFYLMFLMACVVTGIVTGAKLNFVLFVDKDNAIPKAGFRKGTEGIPGVKEEDVSVAMVEVESDWDYKTVCENLLKLSPSTTLAIDATREGESSVNRVGDVVKEVVRKLGIPTISATPTYSPWPGAPLTDVEKEYLIKILPPDLTMSGVIKSVVSSSGQIKTFMVVYDNTFSYKNKVGLLFDNIACGVGLAEVEDDEALISDVLEKIGKSDVGNIFVLARVATVSKILAIASQLGMFKPQYGWFVISKESSPLSCPSCVNGSVVFVQPLVVNNGAFNDFAKSGVPSEDVVDGTFFFDLTRRLTEMLIKEVGKDWPEALTYPADCTAELTDEQKAEREKVKLKTLLEAAPLKGVYGDFIFKSDDPKKTGAYQQLNMQINHNWMNLSDVRSDKKLAWRKQSGVAPQTEFVGDAGSISNYKATPMLRISVVLEPPFIYRKEKANGEIEYEGLCIDLINLIREVENWNFEYRITVTSENIHGSMHAVKSATSNVSWDGVIGDIVNGTADIGLGPLAVMAERETAVDFTVPFYDLVGISILMKKAEPKSSLFKFLTVLEANVWACIIGAYFFTSFLMFLFDRLSPYSYHNNKEKYKDDEETRDFSLKESLWFCITSLTPQGGGEAPRNLSGRLVAATWWLFGFIIIASYTANLAAFLTVSRLDSTIESLDDLAKQYKIKYAPVEGSTAELYFSRMAAIEERFYEIWKNMSLDDSLNETERAKLAVWDYPVSDKYTKIWWTMRETGSTKGLELGINKTLESKGPQEGFALIAESTIVRYQALINCKLIQVGNEFSRKPLALAVPKGSEIRDRLSAGILKLLNDRRLEYLKEKWWTENPYRAKCPDKSKDGDGIAIENIGGVFIVIFIGIVLALLTLFIEFLYFKGKRSSTRVITVKDFNQPTKDPIRR